MAVDAMDRIEAARLRVQGELDAAKTPSERNRLGQFATPTTLATQLLGYAKTLLLPGTPIRFLDPAFGTGSFYSALLRIFPHSQIAGAVGYEVDPDFGQKAQRLWQGTLLRLAIADFTRAGPPAADEAKANLLVCNPPYVRHHHLTSDEKRRLQQTVESACGVRLGGLAGLYCYFLCLSHRWMADNGLAVWLIPSEFMDVNYGQQVREYLLSKVTLLQIHRFEPHDVQFGDALVSSAVVWLRNTPPPADHSVRFSFGGTLAEPGVTADIAMDLLRGSTKWTRFPMASGFAESAKGRSRLSDLFTIKRGVATGANGFFILTAEQVRETQIPAEFLKPVLPSPRYLVSDEIEADAAGNPVGSRGRFLLSCRLPEEGVRAKYPSLWSYLQHGQELGISSRYLCRHRCPWYSQEERPPAPFLCTYMGRQGTRNGRAFRFILNHSKATAPNVYLMLYPKPRLRQALDHDRALRQAVWRALNEIAPETLVGEGRVYGGGLHKIEPKELGNAPADGVLAVLPGLGVERARQLRLLEREDHGSEYAVGPVGEIGTSSYEGIGAE